MSIKLKGFRRPISISFSKTGDLYCLCDGLFKSLKIFKNNKIIKSILISDLGLTSAQTIVINNKSQLIILDSSNQSLNWFTLDLIFLFKIKIPGTNYGALYFDSKNLFLSVNDIFKVFRIDDNLSILEFYDFSNLENCLSVDSILFKNQKLYLLDSKSSNLHVVSTKDNLHKQYLNFGRDGKSFVRNPTSINYINKKFYINDNKNYLIQWFDSKLNFIDQIGGKGTDLGKFDLPIFSLVFDNNLIICDKNNDRVLSLDINNKKPFTLVESQFYPGELRRPSGLATDDKGNIYVSDRSNNVIQVFDSNLKFIKILNYSNQPFDRPASLAIIDDKLAVIQRKRKGACINLFKINFDNYSLDYDKKFKFKYKLNDPQDMCSTIYKSFLIADTLNRSILEVNLKGEIINKVDMSKISGNARILVKSVYCREDGHIFTADFEKCIIYQFDRFLNLICKIDLSKKLNHIKVIRSIYANKKFILIGVRGINQLLKINFEGKILKKINNFNWNHPVKIINDKNGKVIIADKENDRVVKI